ncbi:MAG: phosphosulfolactate synthase [Alphaproteobacteria bacterium]|nr:phosphosulfolactate synthase [Alphaproteobacteria bacterium]
MTLALPQREGKPRKRGLTTMIDFGPDEMGWSGGANGIRDLLDCAADYIDHAKIYALNGLLLPEAAVKASAKLYRDYDCHPFAGGMLFEYAWAKGELDGLEALLRRVELMGFEISENYITLGDDERKALIERFQKSGFEIVYEFGRKAPSEPMKLDELGAVIHSVAECGIDHVIVEQSEIDMLAEAVPTAMAELREQNWFDRIVIEADPYRFPEQHAGLIREFGADVNLCNIASGQVLRLEGLRRGIGRAVGYSIMDGLI